MDVVVSAAAEVIKNYCLVNHPLLLTGSHIVVRLEFANEFIYCILFYCRRLLSARRRWLCSQRPGTWPWRRKRK